MKASDILHKKRFVQRRADGTVRIVRDSYHSATASWWQTRATILKRDGNRCRAMILVQGNPVRCPCTTKLEVHHIKPLSRGGKTIPANLITLCQRCHDARHSHLNR